MIDTVLLCMAWAVIGYSLAIIEHERSSPTSNPRPPPSVDHAPLSPVANAISLKHRQDRFACYHCKRWRHNQRLILRGATEIMPNSRKFAQNTTRSIATITHKLLTFIFV